MSDTEERLRAIVVEHLGIEGERVVPGASFLGDLGADSLDSVLLSADAEDRFGIDLNDDEALDSFGADGTFGGACALIDRKLAASAS